eukprot:930539-Lingulodinium_polyedra.AAC.1
MAELAAGGGPTRTVATLGNREKPAGLGARCCRSVWVDDPAVAPTTRVLAHGVHELYRAPRGCDPLALRRFDPFHGDTRAAYGEAELYARSLGRPPPCCALGDRRRFDNTHYGEELVADGALVALPHAGDPVGTRVAARVLETYPNTAYVAADGGARALQGGPSGRSLISKINSAKRDRARRALSLIHISEPTRR